ncbi:aspartate aminotransferase family protein [Streptomyces apocyni]|uniref:aspartate aminotransferase family protein n=1 Tax=Streptomyces apocyni TaxID=2654677 RepID=UPI0012EA773D|nr:aminotransferase class III-fold pyridoxal phosphate-dependent enzyme [Streptomyces apocyni]
MSSAATEQKFADGYLSEKVQGLGIARAYTRAQGNTLYYLDEHGEEAAVLDYVGGFGSLMFGHNNPEINAHAKAILDAQTPVFTLMLGHSYANEVATAINKIVQRELDTDEPHYSLFANSGAEGVEIAIKHTELDRGIRIAELLDDVEAHIEAARAAVDSGAATLPDGAASFDALAADVRARNTELAERAPVFLALERAFHGKLTASVQLTYNPDYRTPFKALAAQSRFVPADEPETLREVVAQERRNGLDVVVREGQIVVVERDFPVIGGFFLEVIRGEAGIWPVSREFAQEVRETADDLGCPLVVDEIQSGLGRTGAFLASTHIGLQGDYYVLAKSLGGGIAKTAAVIIRESRYRKDFELIHSSTFAKDSFSSLIAIKVLEMLEADDGKAYKLAAELGRKLTAVLESLRADFPDVFKDVRGTGLMLGLELHEQPDSASGIIREISDGGGLGYVVSAHILREHLIRIFPTASAGNTLRLEPSIYLTDAEIDRLDVALRATAKVLRDADGQRLVGA